MSISKFGSHPKWEAAPLQTCPTHAPCTAALLGVFAVPGASLHFHGAVSSAWDRRLLCSANCSPILRCPLLKTLWSLECHSSGEIIATSSVLSEAVVTLTLYQAGHVAFFFWSFLLGYALFKVREKQDLVLFILFNSETRRLGRHSGTAWPPWFLHFLVLWTLCRPPHLQCGKILNLPHGAVMRMKWIHIWKSLTKRILDMLLLLSILPNIAPSPAHRLAAQ